MSNGFYSSRNQTVNSYVLRSASKSNASRKQGVYSKFLNRTNVSKILVSQGCYMSPQRSLFRDDGDYQNNGFKQQYEASTSRIDQLQTLNSRKSLFKGNESFNPRGENEENNTTRGQNGLPRRPLHQERMSPPRNNESRIQNGLPRGAERMSPPRTNESRAQNGLPSRVDRMSPPRINESRVQNGMNGRLSPSRNNESRLRAISPPGFRGFRSPVRNGHIDMSNRDTGASSMRYNGNTPEREGPNSAGRVGPELSPRVILRRFEPEFDEYGRPVGLKRDGEGFLVPNAPNPKRRLEEDKRTAKKILSELTDSLFSAEAFYFLKRCEDILNSVKKKINIPQHNGYNTHLDERKAQVVKWLQSTNNAEGPTLPVPDSVINVIPREVLQDYAASIISNSNVRNQQQPPVSQQPTKETITKVVYSLRDWTIIKGRAPIEVMVSGDLLDINNQSLIEEGHISSKVLSADAFVVQTSCCIYHLSGEFVDSAGCIPASVKKYFQNGKFPKEWRDVIRMWSILKDRENSNLYNGDRGNQTTYDDSVAERDDVRRVRPKDDRMSVRDDDRHQSERIPERIDQRNSERREIRVHPREDQRQLERLEQASRNREDMRARMEEQRAQDRDDQRIRNREQQRIREREQQKIREREDQRIREREEQRIREREEQRIREREDDLRMREREDLRMREIPECERPSIEERDESDIEERDGNDRVRFREAERTRGRNEETYDEVNNRNEVNASHLDKKRKSTTQLVAGSPKRRQMEKKRLETPGVTRRIQFRNSKMLTRSARRRQESFFCTPKSSKRITLKSRRKTPMPPKRGRKIDYESLASISFDNSDLM